MSGSSKYSKIMFFKMKENTGTFNMLNFQMLGCCFSNFLGKMKEKNLPVTTSNIANIL